MSADSLGTKKRLMRQRSPGQLPTCDEGERETPMHVLAMLLVCIFYPKVIPAQRMCACVCLSHTAVHLWHLLSGKGVETNLKVFSSASPAVHDCFFRAVHA